MMHLLLRALPLALLATACAPASPEDVAGDTAQGLAEPPVAPEPTACGLPIVTGPCRALFRRWAFDADRGRCVRFVYGGCDGNANNFASEAACAAACADPAPAPPPALDAGAATWRPNTGACAAVDCLEGKTCWSNGPLWQCR